MAVNKAPGYGQHPNGVFPLTVFSKDLLMYFRAALVAQEVTNTNYEGEVKGKGDKVKILKEPVVTVNDYNDGGEVDIQYMSDEDLTLNIDTAKSFAFTVSDIENTYGRSGYGQMLLNGANFSLKKEVDSDVLSGTMADGGTTHADLGTNSTPATIGYGDANDFTPLNYINRAARIMDENELPDVGRFIVAPPVFWESLGREESSLTNVSITGDGVSAIRERKVGMARPMHGFDSSWKTTQLTDSAGGYTRILFGHIESTSMATALSKVVSGPMERSFNTLWKGLVVYGKKIVRPEALFTGHMNITDVNQ